MKKLILVAALVLVVGTTATAETCLGARYGVAFYSTEAFEVMVKVVNSGASALTVGYMLAGMVKEGSAVWVEGMEITDVVIMKELEIAAGTLPDGSRVAMIPEALRCK